MSKRLDAHLVRHGNNYVLIMSPFVARCIRDACAKVNGSGPTRRATDIVWELFNENDSMPWNSQDYHTLLFEGCLTINEYAVYGYESRFEEEDTT